MKLVMMCACHDLRPRCEVPSGRLTLRSARAQGGISHHSKISLVRPQNQEVAPAFLPSKIQQEEFGLIDKPSQQPHQTASKSTTHPPTLMLSLD